MKRTTRLASLMMICATTMPVAALAFPIAAPGTEGFKVVVAGTEAVIATYQGNSATHSDDLYLMLDASGNPGDDGNLVNDRFLFNNHASPVGSTVNLGSFPIGTELEFRLRDNNSGYDFFTGPASRNPDDSTHARVQSNWQPTESLASFEDLYNGPFNYNDLSFSFTNTAPFVITASAGPGGVIAPSGAVGVNQGASQIFTVTPAACYNVADVKVDDVSKGAITIYKFDNVQADHTIAASFVLRTYEIAASAGVGGSISPAGNVSVGCGASQDFTITPDLHFQVADVLVDGDSVGARTSYTFSNVMANHTIVASFSTTGINHPPDCSHAAAGPARIWPPNHKLVPVTIVGVTDPDGDPVTITVTGITQDEPLNTRGDGNTCPDGQIVNGAASVRAERTGSPAIPGNGRVYAIGFTARDGRGGSCNATVYMCVPHDQGNSSTCIDDGQKYNALGPCGGGVQLSQETTEVGLAVGEVTGTQVTLEFSLAEDTQVEVGVFDVAGRRLATVENGSLAAGVHQRAWDMSGATKGLYFVRLRAGAVTLTKMVVKTR